MEIKKKNIYFLGIGGIGMSAVAQYFHFQGYNVAGYDRTKSDVCILLENIGIDIHYDDNIEKIPNDFLNKEKTLIVITPAIPQNNNELNFFKKNNFLIKKRSEILGFIANNKICIAIAGSHGKTSTAGITTNILLQSQYKCSAFLGGILKNINSNYANFPESDFVVAEADEFDRSFLNLKPKTAVITYIDPDHLDIYKNFENLKQAFADFANQIIPGGNLLLSKHIEKSFLKKLNPQINVFTYSVNDTQTDFYSTNIKYSDGTCIFDLKHPKGIIHNIKYSFGGNHNIENATAAAAICLLNNIDEENIINGINTFAGIKRRFDIQLQTQQVIYIDDYAHHPREIKAFLEAVKLLYPKKHITGIFQPHLFSRTADFYKEFAESLSICDRVILLPIYPARELPIEGVSSDLIYNYIKNTEKMKCNKNSLLELLKTLNKEIVLTMGAGDIDQLTNSIKNLLINEK